MNVLVTGATGFIGSHLLSRLLPSQHRVRVVVRPGTDAAGLAGLGVEIVRGDISDPRVLADAVSDCGVIYHLAKAPSSSSRSTMHRVNVEATAALARAAQRAGIARLVHASTAAVYGSAPEDHPLREECRFRADSP